MGRRVFFPKRPIWVPTFLVLNTLVFGAWLLQSFSDIPHFTPPHFLEDNFLVSANAVLEGRWWTLLTANFSHNLGIHFLFNMIVLMNFGPIIESILGRARFFVFYMVAGTCGSLGHVAVSLFVLRDPSIAALGASGALAGVILFFSLAFPRERLYIFGLIPIPAILGAIAFVGFDVWGLIAQSHGGGLPIGHGAHLGGAAAGLVYFFIERKRRQRIYNPY
ncbi:MAG: rhomboid family intramembrane serine protease [Bdellovibrionales bacterium]|nr:rhomboid family intramembrane serine protease [Bdellovibrionales bacterium]